jgi:hypothetical protein
MEYLKGSFVALHKAVETIDSKNVAEPVATVISWQKTRLSIADRRNPRERWPRIPRPRIRPWAASLNGFSDHVCSSTRSRSDDSGWFVGNPHLIALRQSCP